MLYSLTDRTVIRLSGVDTHKLLQGIITNNVLLLESQSALFSALLNPQGKFLHDFFLVRDGDDMLLETETVQAEGLLKLLTMYRLRAKVTFTPLPDWRVYATVDASLTPPGAVAFPDPRHPELGMRLLCPADAAPTTHPVMPLTDYETLRLFLGIPEGWKDAVVGRSLLLEMGYDKLNGVDFAKGCYVGQEVTARSKFRATLRKCLYQVKGDAPLPPFGTELLTQDGKPLGEMRSSHQETGLALIRTDMVEGSDAKHSAHTQENHVLTLYKLPWI
jgi:folate-binding protein YgfZ